MSSPTLNLAKALQAYHPNHVRKTQVTYGGVRPPAPKLMLKPPYVYGYFVYEYNHGMASMILHDHCKQVIFAACRYFLLCRDALTSELIAHDKLF